MSEALALQSWPKKREYPERTWRKPVSRDLLANWSKPRTRYLAHRHQLARMPEVHKAIAPQIQKLLSLSDNWDGEGSAGYELVHVSRVVTLVTLVQTTSLSLGGSLVSTPIISASEDSIDLMWKDSDSVVLVNVPNDQEEECQLYATSKKNTELELTASPDFSELPYLVTLALKTVKHGSAAV